MKPKPTPKSVTDPRAIRWPTQSGYHIVENTVPENERLDGGKGVQTIRRVIEIGVIPENPDDYIHHGSVCYGDRWYKPGVYVRENHGRSLPWFMPVREWNTHWTGRRFIYLDLDAIAEAAP